MKKIILFLILYITLYGCSDENIPKLNKYQVTNTIDIYYYYYDSTNHNYWNSRGKENESLHEHFIHIFIAEGSLEQLQYSFQNNDTNDNRTSVMPNKTINGVSYQVRVAQTYDFLFLE